MPASRTPAPSSPTTTILAIAAASHGVVTTAEAKEHGLHPNALLNRARSGVLERVDRGVYLVRGSADTPARRAIVACRRAGTAALLSHRAGGLHWTLDGIDHAPMEVLVARWSRPRRRAGLIVHESTLWRPGDARLLDGVPITSPERTIIDLASCVHPYRLEQAIEDAARRGLCSYQDVANRFVGLACNSRRGTAALSRLLAERVGERVPTQAMTERRAVQLIRAAHLPEPARQIPVALGGATVYLDLGWPHLQLAIECDGLYHHATNHQLPWDLDRQNHLLLLGWLVLRFTWRQLTEEADETAAVIRRAYEQRVGRLASGVGVPHHAPA